MNKFTALAGTGLLLIGSAGFAQDIPSPADAADPLPEAATTAPMDTAPADATVPGDELPADATAPSDSTATAPDAGAPADSGAPMTSEPATGEVAFTDDQIQSFAAAALEIQNLPGDAATKQEQAATIVASSGLDAATFNAIGQAMQTDPAVAERVQLAAAGLQGQPEG
jgi:hypothetical protein